MANIEWAKKHFDATSHNYKRFGRYYCGDHDLIYLDQTKRALGMFLKFARYNQCPLIVDTLADRLSVSGFDCDNDIATAYLEKWWKIRRMNQLSASIHMSTVLNGDAYVIVWQNTDGRATVYEQNAENIAVRYDASGDTDAIQEAVKLWQEPTCYRMNHYTVSETTRYYLDRHEHIGNGLFPTQTEDWYPLPPEMGDAVVPNPYGVVPVFRFCNSLNKNMFCRSELVDVLPLQDTLNKEMLDMITASEFAGFRQRWATGIDIPTDPNTGKPVELYSASIQRMWVTQNEAAKFGTLESTDLTQFLKVLDNMVLAISRVSRTPLHLLLMTQGGFPSGEALKTAEAPLLAKVAKRQTTWGCVWEDILRMVCQIDGVAAPSITTEWRDTTPHSDKEQAETNVMKLQLGVSKEQVLSEMGYSDDQIARMREENSDDRKNNTDGLLSAFAAGNGTGVGDNETLGV